MHDPFATFLDPPREFGLIPLWFWNDDLQEAELLRQLREFHRAGFGGIIPHPRIGLSKRIGYLTDEYFRLVRLVVEECARLGMKVILYDEGCYPSGSARGQVVAENPEFASQCLALVTEEVDGARSGFWRPNTGRALMDKHVCTVLGRMDRKGRIIHGSLRLLEPQPHDLFRIEVGSGLWTAMSVWQVCSGGHIRGVFAEEESGHQTAPPAADVLNPEAVACFIHLTHDRYHEHLKKFFGTTIIAMFTDEPHPLGKGPHRTKRPQPYTSGFVDWLAKRWGTDPRPWLPSLWLDFGEGTAEFRERYARAVHERMQEVFYGAQSKWCREHGIALTGHPSAGNEMSAMHWFQFPGQDIVGRSIEPGKPSALEGEQSVAAKAATSGARLHGRRRILTEVGGAYGWRLTLDELKWLYDWHLVRGNNLINPHAVFYSICDRRAWESEPDIGVHNVWWPHFHRIAMYARRVSWLLSDGEHVCEVAILGDGNNLPWGAAKVLCQNQIDFLYLDDKSVADATIEAGRLVVGEQRYRVVIMDGDFDLGATARKTLAQFLREGSVHVFRTPRSLLNSFLPRDVVLKPRNPDLRFIHYRKLGLDFFFLVNEGQTPIRGRLTLRAVGGLECWDPWTGRKRPVEAYAGPHGLVVTLHLERRESLVLVVNPAGRFDSIARPPASEKRIPLKLKWQVQTTEGRTVPLPAPGDWARCRGFELFTGTLVYRTRLALPKHDGERWLDLGKVGDIAEVLLDGKPVGVAMWSPYRIRMGRSVAGGEHALEVRVTNSMANEYDGLQLPSGLIGPVRLIQCL